MGFRKRWFQTVIGASRPSRGSNEAYKSSESRGKILAVWFVAANSQILIEERKPTKINHIKEFGGRNAPEASQG